MNKDDIKNLFSADEEINTLNKEEEKQMETTNTTVVDTVKKEENTMNETKHMEEVPVTPKKKRTRTVMDPVRVKELSEKILDGRLKSNKTYNTISAELGITAQQLTGIIAQKRAQYKLKIKEIEARTDLADADKKNAINVINGWLSDRCPMKEPRKKAKTVVLDCEKETMAKLNSILSKKS